jgi:hypothetical protein
MHQAEDSNILIKKRGRKEEGKKEESKEGRKEGSGMMAHACNFSYSRYDGRRIMAQGCTRQKCNTFLVFI